MFHSTPRQTLIINTISTVMAADREEARSLEEAQEEEVPLLGNDADGYDNRNAFKATKSLSTVVLYFMVIHFLLAFCEMILVAPLIKLFEESLCLTHYNFPIGGVGESLCKVPEVQRPLATIRGWKSMFDTLPGKSILHFPKG